MTPQKIKQIRDRHGLSVEELARLVYTTKSAVYHWESGRRPVCPARYELALRKLQHGHPDTEYDLYDHLRRMGDQQ